MTAENAITRREFVKYIVGAAAVHGLGKNIYNSAVDLFSPNDIGSMEDIEERFFDDKQNPSVSFEGMTKKYGDSGHDSIVENISMRALGEKNNRRAVYSTSYQKDGPFGKDYAAAKTAHEEDGQPWVHFGDREITRKLHGAEGFIDII